MSTFDGLVDEFPGIRIDNFRHHPGKNPPQACFLSHVHSDHLQGLETLKMPFVYCSVATKRILLRMEKYPHRINFAKGILEARKQTYRSLKLVLRALPLETPVEIELGPKSKIRVTLFDANHCPGAVMFLIEGHDQAILYTGDVRAEPWWVNAIVRHPILLPYSCGVKKLDCIYLDTTFASRDDVYEQFPTKADGLKELLAKVSKCPKSSFFYFRSWTLGYEDVWITLSNFLQSRIHVDAYQFRIFNSLADDVSNTDRGPALAGFECGNQRQPGCLTNDTNVSIHSCEPGTDCFDNIKKHKNVVWITPIISRLKDGTEIAEIGAGGGGGDLFQTPQLEYVDEATMQALEQLCANNSQLQEAFSRLARAFSVATARGDSSITLEGLTLDQEEEITLKEFVQLISQKDQSAEKKSGRPDERLIHFPYSRHSSFSELRHLISSFSPRDVCPCTVDLDSWSEEVSMQSLFGDLCGDSRFKYDVETRARVTARRPGSRGTKRKRSEDEQDNSQETETQKSVQTSTEEVYTSAKTSIRKSGHQSESYGQRPEQHQLTPESHSTQVPTPVRRLQKALSDQFNDTHQDQGEVQSTSATVNAAAEVHHHPSDPQAIQPTRTVDMEVDEDLIDRDDDSDTSVPLSIFDSQSDTTPISEENPQHSRKSSRARPSLIAHGTHAGRIASRTAAYRAARATLEHGNIHMWTDLKVRSLGWKGHTETEEEL